MADTERHRFSTCDRRNCINSNRKFERSENLLDIKLSQCIISFDDAKMMHFIRLITKGQATMKKLSDSEFEIMKILWSRDGAMTSNEVLAEMKGQRDWKLASLMTVLARMVDKGYVYCDRSTRTNYYSAVVGEEQYRVDEGERLLDRLFHKSATNFIASLYQGKKFSEEEIKELRAYLDSLEDVLP